MACDHAHDPRALVGLAQVALAQGRADFAEVLAREALRLEPANAQARTIVDALPLAA